MGICVNCGQQIADNASFCTHCGAPQTPRMQASDQGAQYSTGSQGAGYNSGGGGYDYSGGSAQGNQGSYNNYSGGSYQGSQNGYDYSGGSYQGSQNGYDYSGGNAQGNQGSYNNYSGGSYQGSQNNYDYAGSQGTPNGYNYSGSTSTSGASVPSMTFADAVRTCIREKYMDFNGRARRSEYWYFVLFQLLVNLAASLVGAFFVRNEGDINILATLASLALFLPSLSVAIRRLHDIGKSGWWYLISAIPLIGWIIILVFYCRDSDPGPNQYGPSPKYPG